MNEVTDKDLAELAAVLPGEWVRGGPIWGPSLSGARHESGVMVVHTAQLDADIVYEGTRWSARSSCFGGCGHGTTPANAVADYRDELATAAALLPLFAVPVAEVAS